MANGTESEAYRDCSEIRPGMKREFAMMMNQSQFIGSIGRTRSSSSPAVGVIQNQAIKKTKSSKKTEDDEKSSQVEDEIELDVEKSIKNEVVIEEEEAKSGIVDLMSDDEKKSNLEEESKDPEVLKGEIVEVKIENATGEIGNAIGDVKFPCKEEGDSGEVILGNTFSLRRVTRSISKSVKEEVAESNTMSRSRSRVAVVTEGAADVKLKNKMVEKLALDKPPTKLKELLETGLLEGLAVKYLRGSKVRGPLDGGLHGIIKGDGILCLCDVCNGATVVTPNQFELHAGSANKRPPEYIYLENGRTLRDILNACKDVPLDVMDVTIQDAIGCSSVKKSVFCQNCKGSLPDAGNGRTLLCGSCLSLKESEPSSPQQSDTGDRSSFTFSNSQSIDRKGFYSSSKKKGQGRLTRKDLRLHKLGFEALVEGAEVAYFVHGKKLLEGYKRGAGIYCLCCNSEVSPSQFEAHAGYASRRKPYLHIYTSNGVSLHEWAVKMSLNREFSAAENDDLCSICADGGDLLLCDTCPRSFHPECVSVQVLPEGKFHCRYCKSNFEKEKFVEHNANALAAGRVSGVDPIAEITRRCIRIVENIEGDIGGCALCRGHDFSKSVFGPRTVIICDQCEKEYHVGCLKEHKMDDLKELPTGKWFCCKECSSIHSALERLIAEGEGKLSESLLNIIKKKHEEKGSEGCGHLDIRWRLLCGKMASDESRVLLSKAVTIFHQQFDPIADSDTSHVDFIPHMVYGRKSRDQDFGGMYCAILTVNSSIVSAGLFRIFGQEVAELPLVATCTDFQGLGYFQSLFSCIENLLGSFDVKNLVLPAASEAESIWTRKFGFEKIPWEQLKAFRKDYQMMVFQGTSMLYKPVIKA